MPEKAEATRERWERGNNAAELAATPKKAPTRRSEQRPAKNTQAARSGQECPSLSKAAPKNHIGPREQRKPLSPQLHTPGKRHGASQHRQGEAQTEPHLSKQGETTRSLPTMGTPANTPHNTREDDTMRYNTAQEETGHKPIKAH